MRAYGGADANGSAQEELLDEPERGRGYADNPYAWERPLDAVNRVRYSYIRGVLAGVASLEG